jgi:hypothetical protein
LAQILDDDMVQSKLSLFWLSLFCMKHIK